jgi:hypothetical protein
MYLYLGMLKRGGKSLTVSIKVISFSSNDVNNYPKFVLMQSMTKCQDVTPSFTEKYDDYTGHLLGALTSNLVSV